MSHILICGPNGAGKSTLGWQLSSLLHVPFFDIEDYYFSGTDPSNPYKYAREETEVHRLLCADMQKAKHSILASVRGDRGNEIESLFTHIISITVSKEDSIRRVRRRSYDKFGDRALPGGDLYEQEEAFFRLVEKRTPDRIEAWLKTVSLPILYLDGLSPIQENTETALKFLKETTDRSPL